MNQPTTSTVKRKQVGQILIAQGVISEDQLRIGLIEQMRSNQPIGRLQLESGAVLDDARIGYRVVMPVL